jgi:riboflavin synthase
MFTGLVDSVGTIRRIGGGGGTEGAGLEIAVDCGYDDLVEGESISVNGACLTVRTCGPGSFLAEAVSTTLERTAMGGWKVGRRVNLERAMKLGDRLGGHFLQGHVDCVGRIVALDRRADALVMRIRIPEEIGELVVPLGSVGIDGVSLTVNAIPARGEIEVSLIEYTVSHTALADLGVADDVHVEADMIGKHVRRLLAPWIESTGTDTGRR